MHVCSDVYKCPHADIHVYCALNVGWHVCIGSLYSNVQLWNEMTFLWCIDVSWFSLSYGGLTKYPTCACQILQHHLRRTWWMMLQQRFLPNGELLAYNYVFPLVSLMPFSQKWAGSQAVNFVHLNRCWTNGNPSMLVSILGTELFVLWRHHLLDAGAGSMFEKEVLILTLFKLYAACILEML